MMRSQISNITNEMLLDFQEFSGIRIRTPEEYLLFRQQAVSEIQAGLLPVSEASSYHDVEPIADQFSEPVLPKKPALTKKVEPETPKNGNNIHYKNEENEKQDKNNEVTQDIRDDSNFFACIEKIED